MTWFKICLLIVFGASVIVRLARLGGWKPEERTPLRDAISMIIELLCFLGIWFWV